MIALQEKYITSRRKLKGDFDSVSKIVLEKLSEYLISIINQKLHLT